MTTWAQVQDALTDTVDASVGWAGVATFDSDPSICEGTLVRLSVVSSSDEGERADSVDPDDLTQVEQLQETRAQIQIQFESEEARRALSLAETCRAYLKRTSVRAALAALGVAVVQEPGPLRPSHFWHDGYRIEVFLFELPIRFQNVEIDDAGINATNTVSFDPSTVSGVTIPAHSVTEA